MQRSFSMQQSWVFTVYTCMDSHSFLHLKNKEHEKVGRTQGIKIKDKKKGTENKIMCNRERESCNLSSFLHLWTLPEQAPELQSLHC